MSEPGKLDPKAMPAAMTAVRAFERGDTAAVKCPMCGTGGLTIVDRSARPYNAWFGLSCDACGLDDHIGYALGAGYSGG